MVDNFRRKVSVELSVTAICGFSVWKKTGTENLLEMEKRSTHYL